jgi:hypothetical protein
VVARLKHQPELAAVARLIDDAAERCAELIKHLLAFVRKQAEAVGRHKPGLKVLYTSGYTDSAVVHHGRLDEGLLLLTKPYRKPQLAEMVRQALGG